MRLQNKQTWVLLGVAGILLLSVLFIVINSIFQPSPSQNNIFPTPTHVPYTRDANGVFNFTPLQKTIINRTTSTELEENQTVLNKRLQGTVTIYEVDSATNEETDEIRTENGVVISERTNIFNKKTGTYPPKISVYQNEFGEPEEIIKGVSRLGLHISAYIFAQDGFTLFANPNTNTVYEIHRFTPMNTEEYKTKYSEYLESAPEYPQEFSDQ